MEVNWLWSNGDQENPVELLMDNFVWIWMCLTSKLYNLKDGLSFQSLFGRSCHLTVVCRWLVSGKMLIGMTIRAFKFYLLRMYFSYVFLQDVRTNVPRMYFLYFNTCRKNVKNVKIFERMYFTFLGCILRSFSHWLSLWPACS